MERDVNPDMTIKALRISTHTLTWSVTGDYTMTMFNITISTHTLTWSVTVINHRLTDLEVNFNSHAHVERDKMKRK